MQGSPVQYEFIDVSPVEKRLNVEVARDHVSTKLEDAYRNLSRQVTLRGFRKGKAPRSLLEQMYGKRVLQEVLQELLQDSLAYVGTQVPMRMASSPVLEQIGEVKKGQPLRYTARIETFPQVEIKDWEGLAVNRRPAKVTDEELERALQRKRVDHTEMVPIEITPERATARMGDSLLLALEGAIGPMPVNTKNLQVDLSESPDQEQLPGLVPALVGVPLDAVDHPVTISVPADAPVHKDLKGQSGTLKVTVKSCYVKQQPALDDEFAKDTGEAETLEELRQKLRDDLLKHDEEMAKEEGRVALLDELVKRNPVPLPPGFLQRVLEQNNEHYQRQVIIGMMARGEQPTSSDQVRSAMYAEAVRSLSREFALLALADAAKIEVTPADVEMRLAEMAREQDKSVARVKAEVQKDDPELAGLKGSLRMERALDLLESSAKISIVEPPAPAEPAAPSAADAAQPAT